MICSTIIDVHCKESYVELRGLATGVFRYMKEYIQSVGNVKNTRAGGRDNRTAVLEAYNVDQAELRGAWTPHCIR